ncbi:hypothetical protein SLEP1_g43523 [Rubroshorea leprosula]|uniref:Uncharacterized protein n=1 Tax=Rubroshorea leprosula TaxID=152421 RepID=A0AAV5LDD0_9ROSI|nr:hypothetical protein SLEP1_g43523 [Rubroshorea leprosula]
MDHHDLHSSEQQDLLGRASSIPDSSGANAGFEEQLRDSDLDIKGCKVAKLPEIEIKCLSSGNSSTTCTKEDANDMKKTFSLVTTSGDSVIINQSCSGGALMVISPCNMPDNCYTRQHKTESSSSNSTNVIFPASPNDSCQDISADARSSKCHSIGADTSTYNKIKCSVDDSGGKSSALGLAIQISPGHGSDNNFLPWKHGNVENASEVVDDVGARSRDSKLVVIADCKPVIVEIDSILKSNPPTLENAIPGNHDKGESSSELDDALEVVDREIPLGKKPLYFKIRGPSHDFGVKVAPEANYKQQYTLITKSEDLVDKDRTISTYDFDLNEDVAMEAECTELLVKETVSHNVHGVFKPKPVTVMSESGKLVSLPVTSSAANNHNNSKDSCIKGIDLNIASAGVDFNMDLLPGKCIPASSSLPPREASSRQPESFSIDLNCANENEDNFHQMNLPASLRRLPIRNFDLNNNPTSEDTLADAHEPSQDPSPMQVSRHVHAQPFLVVVPNMLPCSEQMQGTFPVQDKSSYKPTLPPPQYPLSWPNPNGFCIDPSNHLSPAVYSSGIIPCVTEQNGPTVFPQVLGSSTHPAFSGASQSTQIPGGLGPNSLATIRPCFDPKNRVTLENRSKE